MVTHRLNLNINCDKVIVLSNGKVIEEGKHSELISKPSGKYKELWKVFEK